jgi:hypothetical protein
MGFGGRDAAVVDNFAIEGVLFAESSALTVEIARGPASGGQQEPCAHERPQPGTMVFRCP